jgi:hypothetical protein
MTWRRLGQLALVPLLLMMAVQVLAQWRDSWPVTRGELAGPDAYMRLVRVEQWRAGSGWYDTGIARSNAPYGEKLHWTRPLDLLLVAGAAPLSVIVNFDTALYIWGTLLSPVLQAIALLTLMWAALPLLRGGVMLLGLLFAAQFYLSFQFGAGRPDHHGLILLLAAWSLGCTMRLAIPGAQAITARWAAVSAALGLWVSVEGLLPLALTAAVPLVRWLGGHPGASRQGRHFALTLLIVAGICFMLERPPPAWADAVYDSFSLPHLFALTLHAAFWFVAGNDGRPMPWRLATLGAAVLVVLGLTYLLFPKVFTGPMADVNPRVIAQWYRDNREVSPLIDLHEPMAGLGKAVAHLGWSLLALPWLLRQAFRRHTGTEGNIGAWRALSAAGVVALALALHEVRWTGLAQTVLLIPYAHLLASLLRRLPAVGLAAPAMRALLVVVFAIGPLFAGAILRKPRTHHRVVGTPYHRNGEGILDTIDLLSTTDMTAAKAIVRRRNVGLLLVCPGDSEADNYRGDGNMPSVMDRLTQNDPPNWLRPVPLNRAESGGYLLFEVTD